MRLKFGCKRPSMLKLIALYSITTEPKLARCQPRAQTISPMRWEQSGLLDSTIINSPTSWCTEFKFSGKMHNAKILFVYFGWKYFSFETVMVLHGSTAETLQRTKFCSLRVSVVTK